MRGVFISLFLIGIGVILTCMWVLFPAMAPFNALITLGVVVWAVWIGTLLTD
jgi:hypothetical protein